MTMTLKIGRRYSGPVASFKQASEIYDKMRDDSGEGASTFPWGKILDDRGNVIADVSYNARVWAPGANLGDAPIYDSRAQAAA